MAVVTTSDLRKTYGDIEALKGVTITVEPGEIYGLLGQNGAGKSTMVKILLGIVRKTDGDATIFGEPAGAVEVRRKVGYLPEDYQFPGYHTATSILDFYGRLYGLSRDDRRRRIAESLDIVGLKKRANYKIKTFSKGMKQRLGIAQSFFHDPEVIFLDEPTDGVDPIGRKEIRELLLQLKKEGRTIFVNSHLLGEVEMISDRVAIMHLGEIIRQGTVADLTRQTDRYVIGLVDGQTFPTAELRQHGYTVDDKGLLPEVEIHAGQSIDSVLGMLSEKSLKLRHLVEKKQTLESVFMKLVDDAEPKGQDRRATRVARPIDARRV